MQSVAALSRRHPVLSYFVLTFLISWGSILIVLGPGGILGTTGAAQSADPLVFVAMLLGPSMAGLVMIAVVQGKAGFRKLSAHLGRWRVSAWWYAVALLTAPLLVLIMDYALSSTSPSYLPGVLASDNRISVVTGGIIGGILVGVFEELGWTGFVIPQLRLRRGVLTTGLILGLIWGLWHLPLFSGVARSSGTVAPAIYLFVQLFAFLPVYRVLMVWANDHTGSLPIAILMHAGSTGTTLILSPLVTGLQCVIFNLLYGAALWLFVAAVVVVNKGRLTARSEVQSLAS